MSGTRAAIRYAKAILSVAEDNSTSAKIHEEMNHIANAIASNPESCCFKIAEISAAFTSAILIYF